MDALTAARLPLVVRPPVSIAADTSWSGMAGISSLLLSASIIAALITGTINLKIDPYGSPVIPLTAVSGTLILTGRGSAHGTLRATGNRLTGKLAGRAVSATF